MGSIFGNPAFYLTLAVIQAVVVLLLVRLLDLYERQPLALVGLVAVWGATGAPAIALAGNRAVRALLSEDARYVFGNAIAPPLVEEGAKGLALIAAIGPIRWLAKRFGVAIFEGLTAGVVYGAAVGVGFSFTEDLVFFVENIRAAGVEAGFDEFLYRRDFFGPAALHHALFTGAFGAGLGLAAWSRRWTVRILMPLAGLLVALLLHAANNGLVELVLVLKYGMAQAAAWVRGGLFVNPIVDDTASTVSTLLQILDYYAIAAFLLAMVLWLRHERKIIRSELAEEVESRLLTSDEWEAMFRPWQRSARYWRLVRTGQFEQWQHLRRLHGELARLALLKWRARRSGDWARVQRARRRVAALATYDLRPTNLPVPATPLVGRGREVADVLQLLAQRETRLVTLTGTGGTGKSRLSLELAARLRDRFASGVFFVELAAVDDAELVAPTIAQALELRETPGERVLDTLTDYLRDKQLLLVLDNFEHVTAAAPAVASLLASAGRVTVLVTSRQALRVSGEVEYPVPPLGFPDPELRREPAELLDFESVALFVERARAVDPAFELTEANAGDVAELCRRLDGLPLALELAAARAKFLPPRAMLDRLAGALDLVGAGGSARPERHRTLRAAIEWSYRLLDEREQRLLARLGVFAGGCSLEAAEAVCADGAGADVLESLESLVDKSLVRRDDGGGRPRFAQLESIREYARERLAESGETAEIEARHARHFVGVAEKAEPELSGPDQADWIRGLVPEQENLRTAVAWGLAHGEADLAVRISAALGRFWEERGALAEARTWLEAALASDDELSAELRAKALHGIGRLSVLQGDYDHAEARIDAALELFRSNGDRFGETTCLWELGWIALVRGRRSKARAALEESLESARTLDDAGSVARALASLGRLLAEEGHTERARALADESLAVRRALEDTRGIANSLSLLGRIALLAGEYDEASRLLDESSSLARRLGDALRLAEALYFQALTARELGDPSADALLYERTMLCRELGDQLGLAECLELAGAGEEDSRRATVLFAAATRIRESLGTPQWPFEHSRCARRLDGARAELGETEFRTAWSEGSAMSRERAVAFMVEDVSPAAVAGPAVKQ